MRERRKFIRLRAPIGVSYRHIKKGKRQRPQLTLIKDISGGGLCLLAKEELRAGDLLDIEIQIPHLSEPVRVVGEVAWYVPERGKGREDAEAGVRFRDVEPKDLHSIFEYVYTIGIG